MSVVELEIQELDLVGIAGNGIPRVGSVSHVDHKDSDPEIAILSERPDGRMVSYLFVFHPTEPVATIYRIRPDVIAGVTASGGIMVWDDEGDDFPMERVGSISPSYLPQTLRIGNGDEVSEVRFTIKNPRLI